MDIAFIGAMMIAIAVAIAFMILFSLMVKLTVCVYKDKRFIELALMGFLWFIILGFALLIIGSV